MSQERRKTYRGWLLVETGHGYYHAIKGRLRVAVGSVKHGDRDELVRRFRGIVDGLEG